MLCLAIATVLGVRYATREPTYNGRTLGQWVLDVKSSDPKIRANAEAALRAMGPQAVKGLSFTLVKEPGLLTRFIQSLGRSTPRILKTPLHRVFNPGQQISDKYAAAEALKIMGTNAEAAVPALGRMLESPNVLLSSAAGQALGKIGPSAVPVLIEALDNGDYNIRANACAALGELGTNSAPAIPRLTKILVDDTGPIIGSASWSLSRIGSPAVLPLTQLLSNTNWLVRRWAVYSLTYAGVHAKPAIPAIVRLLQDTNVQVRSQAVIALSNIDWTSKESGEALLAATKDQDPDVQTAAINALGSRPDIVYERMPQFIELLDSPTPQMRGHAAYALGQLGEHATNALPGLRKLLDDQDQFVREKADAAIKSIVTSVAAKNR